MPVVVTNQTVPSVKNRRPLRLLEQQRGRIGPSTNCTGVRRGSLARRRGFVRRVAGAEGWPAPGSRGRPPGAPGRRASAPPPRRAPSWSVVAAVLPSAAPQARWRPHGATQPAGGGEHMRANGRAAAPANKKTAPGVNEVVSLGSYWDTTRNTHAPRTRPATTTPPMHDNQQKMSERRHFSSAKTKHAPLPLLAAEKDATAPGSCGRP